MARRLALGHLPTPLWRHDALDDLVGTRVWVKRDDCTAGAESGNKVRKLEYLLADALDVGATRVITCGAVQSNHARATALLAARLGLGCDLFLRAKEPAAPQPLIGNLLLDRLAGARVTFIDHAAYRSRADIMQARAAEIGRDGGRAYVIPEGGSNGLGALGYVEAMREVRAQLDVGLGGGPEPYDAVVIACGSGGSATGIALGARLHRVATRTLAMAVCDDRAYFAAVAERIATEARAHDATLPANLEGLEIHDEHKGPAYGVASQEQLAFIAEVARRTGLVLDPVYSGKALFGLARSGDRPRRTLFIHTGGLPGLLGAPDALAALFG